MLLKIKLRAMHRVGRGFTLIELLVVVAIIALIASVVLVSLNNSRIKARNAKRLSDAQQLAKGLELFYDQCGSYPALPSAVFGIRIDTTKSLYSGTAGNCGATDPVNGSNGVLPNGGIGLTHTASAGETIFAALLPVAPNPIDDGGLTAGNRCSENNSQTGYKWGEYSYTSFAPGNPKQYWLYFCLSEPVGSLQAGRYILTERGTIKYSGNLFP